MLASYPGLLTPALVACSTNDKRWGEKAWYAAKPMLCLRLCDTVMCFKVHPKIALVCEMYHSYVYQTSLQVCNGIPEMYYPLYKPSVPYFHDQSPRLLFISSHNLLRLLFEGGHSALASFPGRVGGEKTERG